MKPFVSVIVPCRNEAVSLGRSIRSILAQDYPADRMEVIVSDGRSTDTSLDVLASSADPRLRVIDNPERVTPFALNRAIQASRGDFILRIDAHSTIEPGYLSALVTFLEEHPQAWGAGGVMRTEPETPGPFRRAIPLVLSHRFGVGNSRFRTGGAALDQPQRVDTVFNCCWRRDVFLRVGLFHEQLVRSQDIEMSARIGRAGGTLWMIPAARTTYFARVAFAGYLRHNWLNGIWSLLPAAYLGSLPVGWRHLIPMIFVASVCSLMAAALATGLYWLPLLPAIPYLLVNVLASFAAAWRERDPRLAALLPITFAGLHVPYGAGSIWGALRAAAHWFHPSTPPARKPSTI
jgi:glycosyltransferase involved in cell wall biosynthesis